jgi:hypothetical protein
MDPSAAVPGPVTGQKGEPRDGGPDKLKNNFKCFLPLLHPTLNWNSNNECNERYRYMIHPNAISKIQIELFRYIFFSVLTSFWLIRTFVYLLQPFFVV